MNLSSLVHAGRHHVEEQAQPYPPRLHHPMASGLVSKPYASQPLHSSPGYTYVAAPQAPPSPPMDEVIKCSLPSISSLLGLADGSSPQEPPAPPPSQPQQAAAVAVAVAQPPTSEDRPGSGAGLPQYGSSPITAARSALPPTPPMHSDAGFDGRQSPSAGSNSGYSVASAPGYYFASQAASASSSAESHGPRQPAPELPRRVSLPPTSTAYSPSPYHAAPYGSAPQPLRSYFPSPMQPAPQPAQAPGLYYQRPLPQQFPPPLMPISVTLTPSSGANPWQHHHYISPSSAASFPQSQDRYICQTCNKAFSRPSSLRIHSHSHTGEKPFKCPHRSCGKAFSVRSNMKRHERGCHGSDGGSMA
ncbi:hypothetical protein PZA11_000240 [Diplocarpon coronariae]